MTTEVRKLTVDEHEVQYKIRTILTAEEWDDAVAFKEDFTMAIGGKKMKVGLYGVSYSEWEKVEELYPYPKRPAEDASEDIKNAFALDVIEQKFKRKVMLFEKATGKTLPGESFEKKCEWLRERSVDSIDALYSQIEQEMTCIHNSPLLSRFESDSASASAQEIVETLEDFTSWEKAADTQAILRWSRKFNDYITELPLRRISQEARLRLEKETIAPDPPLKPKRNKKTNRLDPNETEPNYDDPKWQRICRDLTKKKMVLMFTSAMPFPIPGATVEEQYAWLGGKLLGDVTRIHKFIERELFGYKQQFDFFTND